MKSVTDFPNVGPLTQIIQNNSTEFALCRYDDETKKIIQCHQFVRCRDYLGDVFASVESNRDIHIYGFSFNKNNPRPDTEHTSLLLKFPDAGTLKNFQDNFQILKDIEDALGWSTSFPDFVEYPGVIKAPIVWILGDAEWCKTSVALSFYTFILKCLGYKINDKKNWMKEIIDLNVIESGYVDIDWIQYLLSGGLKTIQERYPNFTGYKEQRDVFNYSLHDYSGFVSLGNHVWRKKSRYVSHYGIESKHCMDGVYLSEEVKVAA